MNLRFGQIRSFQMLKPDNVPFAVAQGNDSHLGRTEFSMMPFVEMKGQTLHINIETEKQGELEATIPINLPDYHPVNLLGEAWNPYDDYGTVRGTRRRFMEESAKRGYHGENPWAAFGDGLTLIGLFIMEGLENVKDTAKAAWSDWAPDFLKPKSGIPIHLWQVSNEAEERDIEPAKVSQDPTDTKYAELLKDVVSLAENFVEAYIKAHPRPDQS